MCCANLPHDICNGDDIGGGKVVEWLSIVDHLCHPFICILTFPPQVEEMAKGKKKKRFMDFK
jgi:hypothetical protein